MITYRLYDFDSFLVWLLKTPLYKGLGEDRHIKFLDVRYFLPKEFMDYRKFILQIYDEYVDRIKNFMSDTPQLTFYGYTLTNFYSKKSENTIDDIFDYIEMATCHAVLKCLYSDFKNEDMPNRTLEELNQSITDLSNFIKLRRENASIEEIEKTLSKPIDEYITQGEGFNHIGLCPICEKLFKKNKKNQEYCSRKCQSVGTMRRIRATKN